jgi:hypothetical protein
MVIPFLIRRFQIPKLLAAPSAAAKFAGNTMHPETLARPHTPVMVVENVICPKIMVTPPSATKFVNEMEERYFRTFQTETAAELTGVSDSTF